MVHACNPRRISVNFRAASYLDNFRLHMSVLVWGQCSHLWRPELIPLELEWQVAVSCPMWVGRELGSSARIV